MALVIRKNKATNKKNCLRKEIPIFTSKAKNFITLIQTDKPIYKPGDKVRFRTLILDHETIPYNYQTITVKIIDGNENVLRTFSESKQSKFSMFEESYNLPDEPSLGKWTLSVFVDDDKQGSNKTFLVKDFTPPPFKVFIETKPRVAFETYNPKIELEVYAKYPFDTMVQGTANISARTFFAHNPDVTLTTGNRQVLVESGSTIVQFNLKTDLNIKVLSSNLMVEFTVEFVEVGTGRSVTQTETVEVLASGQHYIKLDRPKSFKPGFSYKNQASVYNIDGAFETNKIDPVRIFVTYNLKNKKSSSLVEDGFLKNGKVDFVLQPPSDAINLSVAVEFLKEKIEETIKTDGNNKNDGFLQVSYEPKR